MKENSSRPPLLQMKNLSLQIGSVEILKNINWTLHKGLIAGWLGSSGSGKTTLLRAIAGFHHSFQGEILLNGENISKKPTHQRGLGFVFQDLSLFPHMSVEENIGFGLQRMSRKIQNQRIQEFLELFSLASLRTRFPSELSGGEQQRVALARSMAPRPQLILMDEPFSGLDTPLKMQLLDDIKTVIKNQNQTLLFVTHSKKELFQLADEGGVLMDQTLQQWAPIADLYHRPVNHKVATFMGPGSLIRIQYGESGGTTSFGPISIPQPIDKGELLTKIFIRPEKVQLQKTQGPSPFCIEKIQNYGAYELIQVKGSHSQETLLAYNPLPQKFQLKEPVQIRFLEIQIPLFF